MRTTVDIDDPILNDLKEVQKREKKSLGKLVSELLAVALSERRSRRPAAPSFKWNVQDMGVKVDLADREAVYDAMDEGVKPYARKGRRR
jgi:hypothetical protein